MNLDWLMQNPAVTETPASKKIVFALMLSLKVT
jgi:hypothetical protein